MSYKVTSGYCPKCRSVVEYDEETETCRCTNPDCAWKLEPNVS